VGNSRQRQSVKVEQHNGLAVLEIQSPQRPIQVLRSLDGFQRDTGRLAAPGGGCGTTGLDSVVSPPVALAMTDPLGALASDDAEGPGRECRRIVQTVQAPENSDPGLLEHVPGGLGVAGESAGMGPQAPLPPGDQLTECLDVALLAAKDKHLIANMLRA